MGLKWFRGHFKKKLKFEWSNEGEVTERFNFKSHFDEQDFNLSTKHSETTDSQYADVIKSENAKTNNVENKILEVNTRKKEENASKGYVQENTREEPKKNFTSSSTVSKSGDQTHSVSSPIRQETLGSQVISSNNGKLKTQIEGTQKEVVKSDSKKEYKNFTLSMQVKKGQDAKDFKNGQLTVHVSHEPEELKNKNMFYFNEPSRNAGVIKEEKQESKTFDTAEINDEIKIVIPQGRQENNVATAIFGLDYEECDI